MTSFKDIPFNDFPIKQGDEVEVSTEGCDNFTFTVKAVRGFVLLPLHPVTLQDGTGPYPAIPMVDHGFVVTKVNGQPFNYFSRRTR